MTDDIDDRLSKRFQKGRNGRNDGSEGEEGKSDPQRDDRRLNVKRDWNARSFYLPDPLVTDLSTTFKRLDLELAEEGTEMTLRKTRHYYPLIVKLGLERIEEMEREELRKRIEQRDPEEEA